MAFSGARLVQARLSVNMSQTDLAVACRRVDPKLRTTPSDISRYENGRVRDPGGSVVLAIATATRHDIEFFYEAGGDEDLEEEAALQAARYVPEALVDRLVEKRVDQRVRQRLKELGIS